MKRRQLKIASTAYLHTLPILTKQIKTETFDYVPEMAKNIDECTMRMVNGDFDVAEMSFATYLKVMENNPGLKALPVFARKLPQLYAFVSENSDLTSYKDLKGKKVAVFQYWVTASIWHRWLLANHFGVETQDIIWCPLRKDRMDNMTYPENNQMNWDYLGSNPDDLLRSGDVDCFFYARRPEDFSGLRWLLPTDINDQVHFLKETAITPITHVTAIKEEILQESPEILDELMSLYEKAKYLGDYEVGHYASFYLPFADWHVNHTKNLLGADWNANGWSNNKHVIETFYKAACEQGFIQQPYDVNDCFIHYDYK